MTKETKQERLARLQRQNAEALAEAASFLELNRVMAERIVRTDMNAPNDEFAAAAVNMAIELVARIAVSVRESKPGNTYEYGKKSELN